MKVTLKIESLDNCPSKNKEITWESKEPTFFTIKSKCYIENHFTLPVYIMETMLDLIKKTPNVD